MALSQSDLDMLNQMSQGLAGGGNIPWSQLLGFFPGDGVTPAAGTATLGAETEAGMMTNSPFAGQPTLGAQEAGGVFGPNMGYLSNMPTLGAQEAGGFFGPNMGYLSNQPTLQTQEQLGFIQPTGADLSNPDIGRVLPAQTQGQATLGQQAQQLSQDEAFGFGLGPNTLYHVPGSGDWGNGAPDVISLAQMRQGLADWLPDSSMQRLSDAQVAAAWAQLRGTQQPQLIQGSGQATLGNQENFAQQMGRLGAFGATNADGSSAAANPYTLAAQQASGYVGGTGLGRAGGGVATTQEQQVQQQIANMVLNAPKGPADAFTYLARMQALGNPYNSVGQTLGGAIQGATGQSLGTLANTPVLTNTQFASDLANSLNGGTMSPLTQSFLARSLGAPQGAPATGGGTAGGTAGGTVPDRQVQPTGTAGGGTTVFGGTHFHLPTGFQTSMQDWNQLSPDAQSAYQDLQDVNGGQSSADFQAGVKLGAPEFKGSAAGSIAPSAF